MKISHTSYSPVRSKRPLQSDTPAKVTDKTINALPEKQIVSVMDYKAEDLKVGGKKGGYYHHQMMDHMSIGGMRYCFQHGIVDYTLTQSDIERITACDHCKLTNTIQLSHNHSHIPAARILERVHCDTLGPFRGPEKSDPLKYYTFVIDEYTRFTRDIPTQGKAGIGQKVMNVLKHWNAKFRERIAYFRTDNAPELPSSESLGEIGIHKSEIPPGTAAKNGLAERANRTILKYIRKICLNFPNKNYYPLLDYIVAHAVYMKNHTPMRAMDGRTPASLFAELPEERPYPYASFGLDVFVSLTDEQARMLGLKFDKTLPHVVPGCFLGFGEDSDTVKVLFSNYKLTVTTSCNVNFRGTRKCLNAYFEYLASLQGKSPSHVADWTMSNPIADQNHVLSQEVWPLDMVDDHDMEVELTRGAEACNRASPSLAGPGSSGIPIEENVWIPPQELTLQPNSAVAYQHPENLYYHTTGADVDYDELSPEDRSNLRNRQLNSNGEAPAKFYDDLPTIELLDLARKTRARDVTWGYDEAPQLKVRKTCPKVTYEGTAYPYEGEVYQGETSDRIAEKLVGTSNVSEPELPIGIQESTPLRMVEETSYTPEHLTSSDVRGGYQAQPTTPTQLQSSTDSMPTTLPANCRPQSAKDCESKTQSESSQSGTYHTAPDWERASHAETHARPKIPDIQAVETAEESVSGIQPELTYDFPLIPGEYYDLDVDSDVSDVREYNNDDDLLDDLLGERLPEVVHGEVQEIFPSQTEKFPTEAPDTNTTRSTLSETGQHQSPDAPASEITYDELAEIVERSNERQRRERAEGTDNDSKYGNARGNRILPQRSGKGAANMFRVEEFGRQSAVDARESASQREVEDHGAVERQHDERPYDLMDLSTTQEYVNKCVDQLLTTPPISLPTRSKLDKWLRYRKVKLDQPRNLVSADLSELNIIDPDTAPGSGPRTRARVRRTSEVSIEAQKDGAKRSKHKSSTKRTRQEILLLNTIINYQNRAGKPYRIKCAEKSQAEKMKSFIGLATHEKVPNNALGTREQEEQGLELLSRLPQLFVFGRREESQLQ